MPLIEISSQIIEGTTYYSTVRRGVSYTAYYSAITGTWQCLSRRLPLGRNSVGGCRHYDDIAQLASREKAFAGLDLLIEDSKR